jgi:hypothetical protein
MKSGSSNKKIGVRREDNLQLHPEPSTKWRNTVLIYSRIVRVLNKVSSSHKAIVITLDSTML